MFVCCVLVRSVSICLSRPISQLGTCFGRKPQIVYLTPFANLYPLRGYFWRTHLLLMWFSLGCFIASDGNWNKTTGESCLVLLPTQFNAWKLVFYSPRHWVLRWVWGLDNGTLSRKWVSGQDGGAVSFYWEFRVGTTLSYLVLNQVPLTYPLVAMFLSPNLHTNAPPKRAVQQHNISTDKIWEF